MTHNQLACGNCQHYRAETWGDNFNEPRVTKEWCTLLKWQYEEPTPSPVTTCGDFEFAIAEIEDPIDFNFEEF